MSPHVYKPLHLFEDEQLTAVTSERLNTLIIISSLSIGHCDELISLYMVVLGFPMPTPQQALCDPRTFWGCNFAFGDISLDISEISPCLLGIFMVYEQTTSSILKVTIFSITLDSNTISVFCYLMSLVTMNGGSFWFSGIPFLLAI